MAKMKFKENIEKIAISPIFISFMVFLLVAFVVYRITVSKVESAYDKQFKDRNLLFVVAANLS